MKPAISCRLLPLVWLAIAGVFASRMIGNQTWVIAPWLALLSMTLFTRSLAPVPGLIMGACVWGIANLMGWLGVLPFQGWMEWVVPLAVSLFTFTPFVVDRLLYPRLPAKLGWMVLPLAWVVMEGIFSLFGVGSWGALVYSQTDFLPLLQGAALFGQAWPVLIIGSFASLVASAAQDKRRALAPLVAWCLIFGLSLSLGALRLNKSAEVQDGLSVGAVVVDNRKAFAATWGPLNNGKVLGVEDLEAVRPEAEALFTRLMSRSAEAADQGAKVIVWSEGNALVHAADEKRMVAQGQALARERGIWMIMAMAVMTPGQTLAENILVVVDHEGRIIDRYLKSHPTPSEASVRGDGQMGWADTPWGRIAWAICYDFDYPSLIAQAGRKGAAVLIDPSWDSAGMTPLHSHMAAMRAIENGAALIRPVNDGLNLAVDGLGRTLDDFKLEYGDEAIWVTTLPARPRAVLFPWVQAFVPWGAGLGLGLITTLSARRWRRRGH